MVNGDGIHVVFPTAVVYRGWGFIELFIKPLIDIPIDESVDLECNAGILF